MVKAVRFRPALRRDQALVVELVVCRPDESDAVAARVAARPALTFRFSGVAYAKLTHHHASAAGCRRSLLLAVGCCCCCHRCCQPSPGVWHVRGSHDPVI